MQILSFQFFYNITLLIATEGNISLKEIPFKKSFTNTLGLDFNSFSKIEIKNKDCKD